MEQRLQFNEVKLPDENGEKVIILQITDIQLHSNARPTQSVGGVIKRSIENNKPGRIFSSLERKETLNTDQNSTTFTIPFEINDPVLNQTIRDYEQKGYRVQIEMPKSGLPMYLGKDAVDFMNSVQGKRILRRIKKDKEC